MSFAGKRTTRRKSGAYRCAGSGAAEAREDERKRSKRARDDVAKEDEMAITDYKLTESDFASTGAEALPDKVVGQAEYVKGMIDGPSKDVIMPKYNSLIDAAQTEFDARPKSAFLKFTGGASSLPSGQDYGLLAQDVVVNTGNVAVAWSDRDFVIPDGYNLVRTWGGCYGIGGSLELSQDFGYISCHVALNGVAEGATTTDKNLLNPGKLTFSNKDYLSYTHDCFTDPCLLKVNPGDRIGYRVRCFKNNFYMYSKMIFIELMNFEDL